jgi:lipid II:glycine glycyltransferase (peptidoglycan interpeptide bridge formation enzyme)
MEVIMEIKELSIPEFEAFAKNHILYNFHQSIDYALLKAEEGYEYEIIGGFLNGVLLAASLILYKKIFNTYYGYAPRGFLIDYSNIYLVETFTKNIKEYYQNKNFTFIKINPEIAIAKLNKQTKNFEYNENYKIIDNLIRNGYKKLKNNMYFESLLPRVNAISNLNNITLYNISKNTRNKVRKGFRKGLTIEIATQDKLNVLYDIIKNKTDKEKYHYNDYYNVFSKNNNADLFLIKVDYKKFLINSQNAYNLELNRNNQLNELLSKKPNPNIINEKMNSDKTLLAYKNDIAEAAKNLNQNIDTYVAGALIIKDNKRITVQISGFDKTLSRFAPNYFLYFAILLYYKENFKYADLNGITADMSKDSPYYGLNRFKLGFNPDIYEYIGEFDLIINEEKYNMLLKSGLLAKELNKN